jgi:uncharacterized protein YheU (UPF0270 family)
MAEFIRVPPERLQAKTLRALLEEFASRDGTDYGEIEFTLEQKVAQLRSRLEREELQLLYDTAGEHWDLVSCEQAALLLES